MKKLLIIISLIVFPSLVFAQTFERNLYYGLRNDPSVKQLQEFLTDQGVYSGPITGNFFSLTLTTVKKFQAQNNITPAAGFFGPLTRAKVNTILASQINASNQQAIQETGTTTTAINQNAQSNNGQQLIQNLQAQILSLQNQIINQQNQTTPVQPTTQTQQVTNQPTPTQSITQTQPQNIQPTQQTMTKQSVQADPDDIVPFISAQDFVSHTNIKLNTLPDHAWRFDDNYIYNVAGFGTDLTGTAWDNNKYLKGYNIGWSTTNTTLDLSGGPHPVMQIYDTSIHALVDNPHYKIFIGNMPKPLTTSWKCTPSISLGTGQLNYVYAYLKSADYSCVLTVSLNNTAANKTFTFNTGSERQKVYMNVQDFLNITKFITGPLSGDQSPGPRRFMMGFQAQDNNRGLSSYEWFPATTTMFFTNSSDSYLGTYNNQDYYIAKMTSNLTCTPQYILNMVRVNGIMVPSITVWSDWKEYYQFDSQTNYNCTLQLTDLNGNSAKKSFSFKPWDLWDKGWQDLK